MKQYNAKLFFMCAAFFFAINLFAQVNVNPLTANVILKTPEVSQGSHAVISINVSLDRKFHAYVEQFKVSVVNSAGTIPTTLHIAPTVNFYDKFSKKWREGVFKSTEIRADLAVPENLSLGTQQWTVNLTYQACGEDYCLLPKTIELQLPIEVAARTIPADETSLISLIRNQNFEGALRQGTWVIFVLMFFGGLLTCLTPCIFPMIPITLSIIGARTIGQSRTKSFFLSIFYVLGIAFTYSLLGVFAAKTGRIFGAALSSPWVVIFIAFTFFLMGLSMFGLFEIQVPALVRDRLLKSRTGSGYLGALLSGLIAGIVASPCVGPVLVSVLTYVAKTQDSLLGFFLLFTFALGMGVLFIFLGTFSQLLNRLPRSGAWMSAVKFFFGIVMIIMAGWYLKPLISLYNKRLEIPVVQTEVLSDWAPYSEGALDQGFQNHTPIIIDFYADWCGVCKELDADTFSDSSVRKEIRQFTLLRFDATTETDTLDRLKNKYHILGLPMIVLYDSKGKLRTDLTLTGFETPAEFIQRLKKLEKN